jgi:hypothetical protein
MKIGITGHQHLEVPSAWRWVEEQISRHLATIASPVTAVTSLAVGADQMLARLVLARGGRVHAVIPFHDYERTFDADHVEAYREMRSNADAEIMRVVGTDEDAYLAAGRRVVELADTMIAVWDGKPAQGKGGTADIVRYAKQRRVPLVQVNPVAQTVT